MSSESVVEPIPSAPAAAVEKLAARVSGAVLAPADAEYDEERTGYQLHAVRRPAVVVGAADAADVRLAIEFAAEQRLAVGVQATGHAPVAPEDGGVLITTGRLAGVRIDPVARTARIEAGVRWDQAVRAAAGHGLAPLSGSAPTVGVVGYTLGGGIGLLSRNYGYAADHVRRIEVVTAQGRALVASPEQEPELFWALRGGRDNFGVVTALEIDLFPVARIHGGGMYFAAEHAGAVLEAYRQWVETVPDELTSSIAFVRFPPLPHIPEPIRGRYAAHVRIAYNGGRERGEQLIAPLRAVAPRLLDTVATIPYAESARVHADPTRPAAYLSTNSLAAGLSAGEAERLLELAGPGAPVATVLEIRHLGGALARPAARPNAVGPRGAKFMVAVLSRTGARLPEPAAIRDAHARVLGSLERGESGDAGAERHSMLTFLNADDAAPERVRRAYAPPDYERLARLKSVHDPTNMFRLNHNIRPTGSQGLYEVQI